MITLYDNTRFTDHRVCPRKFYFRHVRNWRRDGTAIPLVFGLAWHAAQDVIWPGVREAKRNVADEAMGAFTEKWLEELKAPSDMDEDELSDLRFRTWDTAEAMIRAYIEARRPWIEGIELLEIELPFAVPLFPDRPDLFYVGRIDKVVRWNGAIWGIEHKTTSFYSKTSGIRPNYIGSFSPNSQIDGYLHALHMKYGDEAKGILVDAALVHKNERAFRFIPIDRAIEQLDAWLWEAQEQEGAIQYNKTYLEINRTYVGEGHPDTKFLRAFPKNTNSCMDFAMACPYLNICKFHANPEEITETPEGMIEEKWEPFDEEMLKRAVGGSQ